MLEDIRIAFEAALGLGTPVQDLSGPQMIARAAVVYSAAIALVRLGPTRLLGGASALDAVVLLVLGSVLSRAVNGQAPFYETLGASLAIVLLHWLMAWLAYHSGLFGKLVKGRPVTLVKDGRIDWQAMRANTVTERDLHEALHENGRVEDPADVRLAQLERSGTISVIPRRETRVLEVRVEQGVQTVRVEVG